MRPKDEELLYHLRLMLGHVCQEKTDGLKNLTGCPKTGMADVCDWLAENSGACNCKAELNKYCLLGSSLNMEDEFLPNHFNALLLHAAYLAWATLPEEQVKDDGIVLGGD